MFFIVLIGILCLELCFSGFLVSIVGCVHSPIDRMKYMYIIEDFVLFVKHHVRPAVLPFEISYVWTIN